MADAAARHQRADHEPHERQHHQHVRQVLAVESVGAVRLGRQMQRLAVREDVRFGQLMEAVDEQAARRTRGGRPPSPERTTPG